MLTISSGPRLMADRTQFEKSLVELPGEGKTYTSREEGTKVWRNKTRRKYYEPVPKVPKDRRRDDLPAIEYRSDRSDRSDAIRSNYKSVPVTDDQKFVSVNELDDMFLESDPKGFVELQNSESYSYIPTVRDVGIQCNRKKTNRHLLNTSNDSTDSYVRVIRSSNDGLVTAYSDVPQLKTESPSKRTPVSKHEVWNERGLPQSEAIYSKVDKSKKKSFREDINRDISYEDPKDNYPKIIYRTPLNERRAPSALSQRSRYSTPGSEYSINTNQTLKNKTKGIGFTFNSGIDGPNVDLPKSSPKLRSRSLNRYEEPTHKWNDSLSRNKNRKEVKEEVLEETISISNASSEDLQPYQTRDFDEFLVPQPQIRELDHKRKEISYINVSPNQRKLKNGDPFDNSVPNGGVMRLKDVDNDYRRGMVQNGVTYPVGNEPSYSTLTRIDNKKKDSKLTESTPVRQAYTLDRRHLKDRQKRLESLPDLKGKENGNSRPYRSTVDLTDRSRSDDMRGGLATAYKNRQDNRPSSLNRMSAIREGRVSPSHSTPARYLSHSHLNSAGNSANSSSDSHSDTLNRHKRHLVHDREPIVMYIPAVSHHNRRAEDEPDRLSGILRPSSRTGSTASSRKQSKKPLKSSASSDITPTKPLNYSSKYSDYGTRRPAQDEELDQVVELKDTKNFGKLKKGKSILNRRHSIPKDTKFPWLQKLKSKVKFRE